MVREASRTVREGNGCKPIVYSGIRIVHRRPMALAESTPSDRTGGLREATAHTVEMLFVDGNCRWVRRGTGKADFCAKK
jgi:hypothetical protein